MLYAMVYKLERNNHPTEMEFATECEMENHYNIWCLDDDCAYCDFFYCDREYTPSWMK